MTKAVVILGAGASADFGVPTLRAMFGDSAVRAYLQQNEWLLAQLNAVFWDRRGVTLESAHESLSIEEMLTILHDLERHRYGEAERPVMKRFKRDLNALIFRALYEGKSTRAGHLNPLLQYARTHFEQTTWATFNWDCIFESSFYYSSGDPEVPGDRSNPTVVVDLHNWYDGRAAHTLLKLHGGINWWMRNGRLTYLRFSGGGELAEQWRKYEDGESGDDCPMILEPSYYKYESSAYSTLKRQWEVFLERLKAADCVLAIGYSLPEADSLARSSITTAFQMNATARWALVDPSVSVCDRYTVLLGRTRFRAFPMGLVGFNSAIEANLAQAFPSIGGGVGPS